MGDYFCISFNEKTDKKMSKATLLKVLREQNKEVERMQKEISDLHCEKTQLQNKIRVLESKVSYLADSLTRALAFVR